ncbi:MAG: hypothetical protein Fur0020_11140 [Thermodesulfovibrionia bacterium]
MPAIEERVYRLESVLEEFIRSVGIEFNKLYNSQMRTEAELREFKDEMRAFKDEMREFKDEMSAFKDETREEHRRMNKRWGEISNKLGTIVEDIIYPALRPVIRQYFKCEPIHMAMNISRRKGELRDEFDAIVECEDRVFLVEVKATPKKEYIDEFRDEKVERFKNLFPEYKKKRLILIFASLRLEDKTIDYLTQNRMYAMAYREWEYMDILNFESMGKG